MVLDFRDGKPLQLHIKDFLHHSGFEHADASNRILGGSVYDESSSCLLLFTHHMEKSPYRTEKNLLTVREKSAYRAEKDLLTAREKTPYRVAVKSAYRAQMYPATTDNEEPLGVMFFSPGGSEFDQRREKEIFCLFFLRNAD